MRTRGYTAAGDNRASVAVVGQMGPVVAVSIAVHTAQVRRSVQRSVVSNHDRVHLTQQNTTAVNITEWLRDADKANSAKATANSVTEGLDNIYIYLYSPDGSIQLIIT